MTRIPLTDEDIMIENYLSQGGKAGVTIFFDRLFKAEQLKKQILDDYERVNSLARVVPLDEIDRNMKAINEYKELKEKAEKWDMIGECFTKDQRGKTPTQIYGEHQKLEQENKQLKEMPKRFPSPW